MREQVLEFIYRRFPDDCHWTDGNCYYFACILKARFEEGEIWYDAVDGHFVFKLEDLFSIGMALVCNMKLMKD